MNNPGDIFKGPLYSNRVEKRFATIAEWHFPATNGEVLPGEGVADDKVNAGIENCDIKLFSEGLHVYQDSWAHRGVPYFMGVGHPRGMKWKSGHFTYEAGNPLFGLAGTKLKWVPAQYHKLKALAAAADISGSADEPNLWPEDVREMGLNTYIKLVKFVNKCDCACPKPWWIASSIHKLFPTALTKPKSVRSVEVFLSETFKYVQNVRPGERDKREIFEWKNN